MRKIIAGLFITLDGVVEAPEKRNPPYYELRLFVHPVIVGPGGRLCQGDGQNMPLTLTQARAHRNGVIALRCTLSHGTVAPTLSEVSQCAS